MRIKKNMKVYLLVVLQKNLFLYKKRGGVKMVEKILFTLLRFYFLNSVGLQLAERRRKVWDSFIHCGKPTIMDC